MNKLSNNLIVTLILCLVFAAFFSETIKAEEVSNFQDTHISDAFQVEENIEPQDIQVSEEMTVYFIRNKAPIGAARRVWLTCNENAIASIPSSSYTLFKVTGGPNLINIVQEKTAGAFYLLNYSPGETVYLSFDYAKGTITQVLPYVGEVFIKSNKFEPLLEEPGPNDGYEIGIFNPGLFGIDCMVKNEVLSVPDADNGVITFIRTGNLFKTTPLSIWSQDGFLGSLIGNTYLQIKVKPGKHYFIGKGSDYSVIEAEVEAGKNYYIELKSLTGWRFAKVQLLSVNKDIADSTLQQWLESSVPICCDNDRAIDELEVFNIRTKAVIDGVLKKVETGEIETNKLLLEDAR
jgi:hypothetical protein